MSPISISGKMESLQWNIQSDHTHKLFVWKGTVWLSGREISLNGLPKLLKGVRYHMDIQQAYLDFQETFNKVSQ